MATMTLFDALLHPPNAQYEASSGDSLRNFDFRMGGEPELEFTLPLLSRLDWGKLNQDKFHLIFSPLKQVKSPNLIS